MYTLPAAPAEKRVFGPAAARVGASSEVRPKRSVQHRLFAWPGRKSRRCPSSAWRRLAKLPIGETASGQPRGWNGAQSYRFIKLRATPAAVQVRRLTLEFGDGSIQDLSIGCLLGGCESRPMSIAGRELKGILVGDQSAARVRGRVGVWAHE